MKYYMNRTEIIKAIISLNNGFNIEWLEQFSTLALKEMLDHKLLNMKPQPFKKLQDFLVEKSIKWSDSYCMFIVNRKHCIIAKDKNDLISFLNKEKEWFEISEVEQCQIDNKNFNIINCRIWKGHLLDTNDKEIIQTDMIQKILKYS